VVYAAWVAMLALMYGLTWLWVRRARGQANTSLQSAG
jgi:hypothetical protein